MGTTAAGWPYVADDDFPLEYPVTSLALANKLQVFDTPTITTLTPQNGYVSGTDVLKITYNGATAHLYGDILRTSGTSLTVLNAGGIPAAARPASPAGAVVLSNTPAGALGPAFLITVGVDGSLKLIWPSGQAASWTTTTTLGVVVSWAV